MNSILLIVPGTAEVDSAARYVRRVDWNRSGAVWEAISGTAAGMVAVAPVSNVSDTPAVERVLESGRHGDARLHCLSGYEWLRDLEGVSGSIVAQIPGSPDGVVAILSRTEIEQHQSLAASEIVPACIAAPRAFRLGEAIAVEPLRPFIPPRLAPGKAVPVPSVSELESDVDRPVTSRSDLLAVRAGLLQMHDLLHDSHEVSQGIEGEGRRAAGDYWHAIMHRREPDYGNSRYWFRRVGRHPLFDELRERAADVLSRAAGVVADEWRGRLGVETEWNPGAFVEMCEAAAGDEEGPLGLAARQIQWREMVLLLRWTCDDAFGKS